MCRLGLRTRPFWFPTQAQHKTDARRHTRGPSLLTPLADDKGRYHPKTRGMTRDAGRHPIHQPYDRLDWRELGAYLGWSEAVMRRLVADEAWFASELARLLASAHRAGLDGGMSTGE